MTAVDRVLGALDLHFQLSVNGLAFDSIVTLYHEMVALKEGEWSERLQFIGKTYKRTPGGLRFVRREPRAQDALD